MTTPTPLGQALRDARRAAGLRQLDVAPRPPQGEETPPGQLTQARLSRIENGQALPTADEVARLAARYRLPAEQRDELVRMADAANKGIRDSRLVIQRGNTLAMQKQWRDVEGSATEVRSFQPILVAGTLQTPGYAAVAMQKPVDSDEVKARTAREAAFDDPDHRLLLIQTEGSLRQVVGGPEVMAQQLEFILEASRKPGVQLGVIPAATPMPFLVASAFHIYDHAMVVVGLQVAAARLTEAEDISTFRALFDQLSALAVWSDDARAELERIARLHA